MSPRRDETDHERGVVAPLYGGCGIRVYATSARNRPVGVTPGIADLLCFATAWGFSFVHETKVKEKQSKEQWGFMLDATEGNVPYVLGDVSSANAFLCWLGIATPLGDTIRFKPREQWGSIVHRRVMIDFDGEVGRAWMGSAEMRAALARWGWQEPKRRPPAVRRASA